MSYLLDKAERALSNAEDQLKYALKEIEEIRKQINLVSLLPEEGRDDILKEIDEWIDKKLLAANIWEDQLMLSQLKDHIREIIQKRVVIKQKEEE